MIQPEINYNSSFQDKKTIHLLKKEIETLKAELEQEKQIPKTAKKVLSVEDIILACEKLSLKDKLKLSGLLNQAIKKQQSNVKKLDKNSNNKTEYIAARIFKTRPAKKAALINTIKVMFQDEMTEADIEKIIFDLQKRNFIKIVENKVTYL
jgi:hypothetical protein